MRRRRLRRGEARARPEREDGGETEPDAERREDVDDIPGDEAATGLEEVRHGVEPRDGVDPAAEKVERDVHGREEEREEDRHLHQRARLHRPDPRRDPRRPEDGGQVDDRGEEEEAGRVDAVAADVHPQRRTRRRSGRSRSPSSGRSAAIAYPTRIALRCGAASIRRRREAVLEVARDAEAGEHAAERRRLEEHEDELERVYPVGKSKPGSSRAARARRRTRGRRRAGSASDGTSMFGVVSALCDRAPRDAERDRSVRTPEVEPRHVRAPILDAQRVRRDHRRHDDEARCDRRSASARASASQPMMMRLRTPSMRYETGLIVASVLNQSTTHEVARRVHRRDEEEDEEHREERLDRLARAGAERHEGAEHPEAGADETSRGRGSHRPGRDPRRASTPDDEREREVEERLEDAHDAMTPAR